MSTTELPSDIANVSNVESFENDQAFQCHVIIRPDDDGFMAFASELPGVMSQGDSINEALDNVRDAFQATMASYFDNGLDVPWKNRGAAEIEPGDIDRWIVVDV